jgi:hypothetical protein
MSEARTQSLLLLQALIKAPITTIDARRRFGILSPPARILALKKLGARISTVMVDQADEHGRLHRVAEYRLLSVPEGLTTRGLT